jgi:hypothetical protein
MSPADEPMRIQNAARLALGKLDLPAYTDLRAIERRRLPRRLRVPSMYLAATDRSPQRASGFT